jgi:hypothetical protein
MRSKRARTRNKKGLSLQKTRGVLGSRGDDRVKASAAGTNYTGGSASTAALSAPLALPAPPIPLAIAGANAQTREEFRVAGFPRAAERVNVFPCTAARAREPDTHRSVPLEYGIDLPDNLSDK